MKRSFHLFLAGGLCMLALSLSQGIAHAQRLSPALQYANAVAARQYFNLQLMNQQQLFNARVYQIYANPSGYYSAPPYASPYVPGYPSYPTTPPYSPPYSPYTPYTGAAANPYMPTAPGYGATTNPYSPTDPSMTNQYTPYGSGYGGGSTLMGSADVLRAYGQTTNAIEQARITRELALQAKLETKKRTVETELYIKSITPTYTQEQEKNSHMILLRIQKNSLPGEIASGKSLNLLLEDLLKFRGKTSALAPVQLSEAVLSHVSVTKSTYGMGLLRDGGQVAWPSALQLTLKEREELDKRLKNLVKDANNVRPNLLTDVRDEIDRLREDLVKRVNETKTPQYLEAKRFLQELYESTRAIEQGEARNQRSFQRFIEDGKDGRSIQEVVEYLGKNALHFGPATAADEGAYRAVHSAMATYDMAMNSQFGVDAKD